MILHDAFFNVLAYILTLWHSFWHLVILMILSIFLWLDHVIFDIMTFFWYNLMLWRTFWCHDISLKCNTTHSSIQDDTVFPLWSYSRQQTADSQQIEDWVTGFHILPHVRVSMNLWTMTLSVCRYNTYFIF